MRLFTKIFLFGMLAFAAAFSASGYFLLHYSMESSMSRETDFALKQYQYDKFTVQSAALTFLDTSLVLGTSSTFLQYGDQSSAIWKWAPYEPDAGLFSSLAEEISVPAGFFAEDNTLIYSEIETPDAAFLDSLSENSHIYQFHSSPSGSFILTGSMIDWNGRKIRFLTQWDVSRTLEQQKTMRLYFLRCYLAAMAAAMVLLGFLSALLTGPLKKMSRAAGRMAEGCYEERLAPGGSDEIGALAESFNRMAAAVEEKVKELSDAARAKEDFVANFAHELKTPLTSIIGYADTIYQKDLPRDDIRKASWHIWNEGMRLEALSLKLMELTVLDRQDFMLQEIPVDKLLEETADGLSPILKEKGATLRLRTVPAYVMADYDLLKTLLINLIDNSLKAGSSCIRLSGQSEGRTYRIGIKDNGCGMEQDEIPRITEAFYMVDKARSRKQHGAGLGLSLAEKIARIHGGTLFFESRKGDGTCVSFSLRCFGGAETDTKQQ